MERDERARGRLLDDVGARGCREEEEQKEGEGGPPHGADVPDYRGVYATRPQLGSGESSIGSSSRSGWM